MFKKTAWRVKRERHTTAQLLCSPAAIRQLLGNLKESLHLTKEDVPFIKKHLFFGDRRNHNSPTPKQTYSTPTHTHTRVIIFVLENLGINGTFTYLEMRRWCCRDGISNADEFISTKWATGLHLNPSHPYHKTSPKYPLSQFSIHSKRYIPFEQSV